MRILYIKLKGQGEGGVLCKLLGRTLLGKKIYFYDTDVYESSNSFYGDSVWFAQKLCMRCHARTMLKMIDIVMNLSLPLPPYLIFTASFQNYLIITVHMVFFILYMRHAVGLVFSHLEHDLLRKWCNDCIYMYIHVRYCFTSPFPGMIKILKLWSSLKGMHIVFCFKMYSRISLKCVSSLIFWSYFKAWFVQTVTWNELREFVPFGIPYEKLIWCL